MSHAFPELRLLLACARLEVRTQDRGAIDQALREDLDWALLLHLARWHGLRPLLHRHLSALAPESVPRPALVELWGEAESIARHNRGMARELARVTALLEERGIASVPYKGPTLALAAYADVALREFADLDLLVARGDLAAARAALCGAGYVPKHAFAPAIEAALLDIRAQYHVALVSPEGRMVELHWKTDPDFPVERGELRAFGPEELMLVLCLHGSKHHWTSLGWLVDIAELLKAGERLDWDWIADRARGLGCRRRAGVGLVLARSVLEAPLPIGADALARYPGAAELAQRMARPLLSRRPGDPSQVEALRLNFAMHEGARRRIRLVAETLLLPSPVEWARWPLPRALFFLYPGLRAGRLAAKYSRRAFETWAGRGKLQM